MKRFKGNLLQCESSLVSIVMIVLSRNLFGTGPKRRTAAATV